MKIMFTVMEKTQRWVIVKVNEQFKVMKSEEKNKDTKMLKE